MVDRCAAGVGQQVSASPTSRASSGPAVAYVVSRWGEPTQTFVRREAVALAEHGAHVSVRSIKRPASEPNSSVTWHSVTAVLRGAARSIGRHPLVFLSLIGSVVRHARLRNIPPHLVAVAIGASWAGEQRPDHYHAHFGWVAGTAAWAAARLDRRTHSIVLHAFEVHGDRYDDPFAAVPVRDAALVYAISKHDAALLMARWGVQVRVLRMGVPDDWLEEPPVKVDDRDPTLLVSVGSLVPKKGHALLLRAVAQSGRPWRLLIFGEGEERAELEVLISELGLDNRVELCGFRPSGEVRATLQRAWAGVLASVTAPGGDRDGIPVFLMESLACGTPAVGSDLGGIPELLQGAGIVVAPSDIGALSAALDSLADRHRWQALATAGRYRIESSFTARGNARMLLSDIDSVRLRGERC